MENEIIEKLKKALNEIKIHDKDLFMIENIISELEDALK